MKPWRARLIYASVALVVLLLGSVWWWSRRSNVSEIRLAGTDTQAWPSVIVSAGDWPWWRGPEGNGEAQGPAPPLKWSPTMNIRWKCESIGRGHASPIVWGNQVFLLTADEESQKILLCSHDRERGNLQWKTELHSGGFPIKHTKNSHASSTPACDGQHVYCVSAVNNSVQVTACTLDGKIDWQTEAGPFISENGYGSSPLVCGPYLIVAGDSSPLSLRRFSQSPSFLAAIDRRTGAIAWRVRRALGHSYGTPILARIGGREQVLLAGPEAIVSYHPENGEEYWRYTWACSRTANSIAVTGDRLLATTSLPARLTVCLKGDGQGLLDPSYLLWKTERYVTDVTTPLMRRDRVYLLEDSGIISCLATEDGKLLWKSRLGRGDPISASPVAHGNVIYAAAENGKTYVFEDGPAFKLLATNDLGEEQIATPAIAGGDLFLRTDKHLWRIGQGNEERLP